MLLPLVLSLAGITFLAILVLYLQARLENRRLHLDRVKVRCKHNTVKTLKCEECTRETQEFFDEDSECESDWDRTDYEPWERIPETPIQKAERERRELAQAEAQRQVAETMKRLQSGLLSRTCVTCGTISYGDARCRCYPT